MFVWTTNTKNQQIKPSYIYNTTTNQNTSKESIATANELAGIESIKSGGKGYYTGEAKFWLEDEADHNGQGFLV